MNNYMKMKKAQLAALARQAGISGRSTMTKAQLAEALEELLRAVEPATERLAASLSPERGVQTPQQEPAEIPELPACLGENRLCLLPQEPRTAFAYWELADHSPEDLTLRVLSVPDGAQLLWVKAGERLGTHYVHLPRAGMEIQGEIGTWGAGGFDPWLRSNLVKLPEDGPSDELETLWMTRSKDFEEIFHLSGGRPGEALPTGAYGARGPGVPVTSWTGSGRKEKP